MTAVVTVFSLLLFLEVADESAVDVCPWQSLSVIVGLLAVYAVLADGLVGIGLEFSNIVEATTKTERFLGN